MGKIKKVKTSYLDGISKVGIFAASLLVAGVAVYVWSPVVGSHADNSDSRGSRVDLNVGSVLSLSVNDTWETTATGTMSSISINGTVTTNDQSGYTVIMSDKDSDTNMVNTDYPSSVIPTISGVETNPGTMAENTWGYMRVHMSGGSQVFPIPPVTNPDTIQQYMHPGTYGFSIPLQYRISRYLPAGTYVDVLTITAYANGVDYVPRSVDTSTISTMQDYDCSELSAGQTTYLKDTRDNSIYNIGKLADGKCWMRNNLKIIDKTITSADSDVSSDFTIPSSSLTDDWHEMDAPRAYKSSTAAYGTYYNWYTATAGTGLSTTAGGLDAPSSVCPKGWKLPTYDDYKTMLAANGYSAPTVRSALNLIPHGEIDYYQPDYSGNPTHYEGHVVAAGETGFIWSSTVYNSTYWDTGLGSGYWSARNLTFSPTTNPSSWSDTTYDRKSYGDAVRCIAR